MPAIQRLKIKPSQAFSYGRDPEFEKLCMVLRSTDLRRVAKEAPCSVSTLWYWTEGVTQAPRLSTLAKVAKVVGFKFKLVKG